jgi:hypothetical protein
MSWEAQAWAAKQRAGGASAKLVLMIYASFANERGWAYPSNPTVSEISELDTKTVRIAIEKLELLGLLIDTGKRTGRTKQVRVLQLGMESLPKPVGLKAGTPDIDDDRPAEAAAARRAESLPKLDGLKAPNISVEGSQNREAEPTREPQTPIEAKASIAPKGAKRDRGSRIAANWSATAIVDLPPQAKRIAEQWPDGAYEAEAEAFHGYWLGEGRAGSKKLDWAQTWHNRIVQLGGKPLRDAKAGLKYERSSNGSVMSDLDQLAAFESTAALMKKMGRADEAEAALKSAAAIRERIGNGVIICRRGSAKSVGVQAVAGSKA